uniref:CRM1_C domain-containing protein n=1 Tax=Heterorhabditis bacteriophora TaxID=37862 RepID=A0A1I7X0S0_HETBA
MSKTVSPFLNDEYAYALELFLAFTIVDDFDLAKVCADFWCWFTSGLCREVPPQLFEMRIKLHANFLSRLRHVLIGIISQPHDVIFIDQLKVTEKTHGIDIIDLYYIRRETLIYLTRLDEQDMIHNIEEELKRQLGDGFCAVKLSKLCYAIGAISGVLPNDLERLLMGKIVCKLIDFMRYINEELRHIACVTFLSIAMKCRCTFVIWHPTEPGPFLEYMLVNIKGITSKLTQYQHDIVYKAIGYMIMAQQDDSLQRKSLEQLLAIPNHLWREIVKTIQLKQSVLIDLQVLTFLQKVLKTNIAVCESLGTVFHTQIGLIYWDMLAIYRFLSENITKTVARSSLKALDCNIIKKSVETKREILALFSTFVRRCKNSPDLLSCIFPSLLGTVLFDYQENVASAKESLILTLITDIVTVMEPIFSNRVPSILDAILMPTLQIILEDRMVFPEHFLCYFRLLLVLITKWCPIVLQIPDIQLKLTVDSIQWAIQNSLRDIGKIGLDTLKALMIMAAKSPDHVAQPFFRKYYMCIIEHLLAVVMNNNQIYIVGFEPYAEIFCVLFQMCEDSITVPLNDYNSSQSNTEFVFSHIGSCLHRHYDNMTLDQIRLITKGFFNFNADPIRMKGHLKDLLVHIRIHHANDPSDLYLNELETEIMVDEERKSAVCALILITFAYACDIIVHVKSDTDEKFSAQVTASNGKKSDKISYKAEIYLVTLNLQVILDGIGRVTYKVGDDLKPVQKDRQGAICKGECAPL